MELHSEDMFSKAMVVQPLHAGTRGRVKYEGSYWPAACFQSVVLEAGQQVRVVDIQGITLIVEPID